MIVLDVDDELGERLELETAAPEPAGVGEERGGGDARHVCGAGAFTGRREREAEVAVVAAVVAGGDREPGPVCEEEKEAGGRVFGSGVGSAAERAAAEQQTPGGQTDSGGRSWEAGGTVGVGMGVGQAG